MIDEESFQGEEHFQYILNGLYLTSNNEMALREKWLTLLDMSLIIATCYNKVVVKLTKRETCISKTFFPIRRQPPLNTTTHIMCRVSIPDHFVQVFFKDVCPINRSMYGVETTQQRWIWCSF